MRPLGLLSAFKLLLRRGGGAHRWHMLPLCCLCVAADQPARCQLHPGQAQWLRQLRQHVCCDGQLWEVGAGGCRRWRDVLHKIVGKRHQGAPVVLSRQWPALPADSLTSLTLWCLLLSLLLVLVVLRTSATAQRATWVRRRLSQTRQTAVAPTLACIARAMQVHT